jgi:hypothetical protein
VNINYELRIRNYELGFAENNINDELRTDTAEREQRPLAGYAESRGGKDAKRINYEWGFADNNHKLNKGCFEEKNILMTFGIISAVATTTSGIHVPPHNGKHATPDAQNNRPPESVRHA